MLTLCCFYFLWKSNYVIIRTNYDLFVTDTNYWNSKWKVNPMIIRVNFTNILFKLRVFRWRYSGKLCLQIWRLLERNVRVFSAVWVLERMLVKKSFWIIISLLYLATIKDKLDNCISSITGLTYRLPILFLLYSYILNVNVV